SCYVCRHPLLRLRQTRRDDDGVRDPETVPKVQTSHLTLPGLNTPTNGSYPGKGPSGMKIKFELKILLGVVFLLMLGGTASADGVLTYQGDATNRPRVIDFDPGGVPAGNGWYLGVNPCNCSVNSAVVRDEFQKATGW